jgi:hypothetical protein
MNATDRFEDPLEPLGVAAGALLVLIGLATIAGQPWEIKPMAPAAVQVLGALATAAIGVLLAWISRTD